MLEKNRVFCVTPLKKNVSAQYNAVVTGLRSQILEKNAISRGVLGEAPEEPLLKKASFCVWWGV